MERVLVTGAAGRLGAQIVRALLEEGHEVVATDRAEPMRSAWGAKAGEVHFLKADLLLGRASLHEIGRKSSTYCGKTNYIHLYIYIYVMSQSYDIDMQCVSCKNVLPLRCDADAMQELAGKASSTIHVGAIPGPSRHPPPTVEVARAQNSTIGLEDLKGVSLLEQNLLGTSRLFEAAALHGHRRVVFSSSLFSMGWSHDINAFLPRCLP